MAPYEEGCLLLAVVTGHTQRFDALQTRLCIACAETASLRNPSHHSIPQIVSRHVISKCAVSSTLVCRPLVTRWCPSNQGRERSRVLHLFVRENLRAPFQFALQSSFSMPVSDGSAWLIAGTFPRHNNLLQHFKQKVTKGLQIPNDLVKGNTRNGWKHPLLRTVASSHKAVCNNDTVQAYMRTPAVISDLH